METEIRRGRGNSGGEECGTVNLLYSIDPGTAVIVHKDGLVFPSFLNILTWAVTTASCCRLFSEGQDAFVIVSEKVIGHHGDADVRSVGSVT